MDSPVALTGGLVGLVVRDPIRFAVLTVFRLLALGFACYMAVAAGIWVPFVPPACAWGASAIMSTSYMSKRKKQQRETLVRIFGKVMSTDIADKLWEGRETLLHDGQLPSERIWVTVMFTDLAGFMATSEKMSSSELLK